jgi:hypothetical protein
MGEDEILDWRLVLDDCDTVEDLRAQLDKAKERCIALNDPAAFSDLKAYARGVAEQIKEAA